MTWILFGSIGILVGLASGLFGIGGGVIMVPAIFYTLELMNISPDQSIFIATKTSLAVILFTSLYSAYNHNKMKPLNYSILRSLAAFVVLGTILGGFLVTMLDAKSLKILFMVYISLVALKMWFGFKNPKSSDDLPPIWANIVVGAVIGMKSAILGIGGGTISIPYLTYRGVKIKEAAGISAALGFIIALIATTTNIINGFLSSAVMPRNTFGLIYIPGVFSILCTSLLFSKIGVKLSHKLPQEKLRKVFALFLMGIAMKNIEDYFNIF